MKAEPTRAVLKSTIEVAMHTATGEPILKSNCWSRASMPWYGATMGGSIYFMTFIDHESRGTGICQQHKEKEETQKTGKTTITFLTINDQDVNPGHCSFKILSNKATKSHPTPHWISPFK